MDVILLCMFSFRNVHQIFGMYIKSDKFCRYYIYSSFNFCKFVMCPGLQGSCVTVLLHVVTHLDFSVGKVFSAFNISWLE